MNDLQRNQLVHNLKQIHQSGGLDLLLDEVKLKTALSIIQTNFNQNDEREELYMLTKAIDALKVKLQEYVNEFQENE